jgi:hypothetical protein
MVDIKLRGQNSDQNTISRTGNGNNHRWSKQKEFSVAVRKSVDTLFCFPWLSSPFGVYARQTAVSICLHGGDLEQEQQ